MIKIKKSNPDITHSSTITVLVVHPSHLTDPTTEPPALLHCFTCSKLQDAIAAAALLRLARSEQPMQGMARACTVPIVNGRLISARLSRENDMWKGERDMSRCARCARRVGEYTYLVCCGIYRLIGCGDVLRVSKSRQCSSLGLGAWGLRWYCTTGGRFLQEEKCEIIQRDAR
jgi:hypothetical protein